MFDAHATGQFFATGTWKQTRWRGVPVFKFPTDLWVYHDLIHEYQPDLIVEFGTARGGSALYFADQMELAGTPGNVISVDPLLSLVAQEHPQIQFMQGSSLDPRIVGQIRKAVREVRTVLFSLDSDHIYSQVWSELDLYAPMITNGVLVVEDTFLGHVDPALIPDRYANDNHPAAAVDNYLYENPRWEVLPDRYSISMNPGGWLHV